MPAKVKHAASIYTCDYIYIHIYLVELFVRLQNITIITLLCLCLKWKGSFSFIIKAAYSNDERNNNVTMVMFKMEGRNGREILAIILINYIKSFRYF